MRLLAHLRLGLRLMIMARRAAAAAASIRRRRPKSRTGKFMHVMGMLRCCSSPNTMANPARGCTSIGFSSRLRDSSALAPRLPSPPPTRVAPAPFREPIQQARDCRGGRSWWNRGRAGRVWPRRGAIAVSEGWGCASPHGPALPRALLGAVALPVSVADEGCGVADDSVGSWPPAGRTARRPHMHASCQAAAHLGPLPSRQPHPLQSMKLLTCGVLAALALALQVAASRSESSYHHGRCRGDETRCSNRCCKRSWFENNRDHCGKVRALTHGLVRRPCSMLLAPPSHTALHATTLFPSRSAAGAAATARSACAASASAPRARASATAGAGCSPTSRRARTAGAATTSVAAARPASATPTATGLASIPAARQVSCSQDGRRRTVSGLRWQGWPCPLQRCGEPCALFAHYCPPSAAADRACRPDVRCQLLHRWPKLHWRHHLLQCR